MKEKKNKNERPKIKTVPGQMSPKFSPRLDLNQGTLLREYLLHRKCVYARSIGDDWTHPIMLADVFTFVGRSDFSGCASSWSQSSR